MIQVNFLQPHKRNTAIFQFYKISILAFLLTPFLYYYFATSSANFAGDLFYVWCESILFVHRLFKLLTRPTLFKCVLTGLFILLHITVVFVDTSLLSLMGSVLNSELLSSFVEFIGKNNSVDDQTRHSLLFLLVLTCLPYLLVIVVRTRSAKTSRYGYEELTSSLTNRKSRYQSMRWFVVSGVYLIALCLDKYMPISNSILTVYRYLRQEKIVFNMKVISAMSAERTSNSKKPANILLILNESFGNYILKNSDGSLSNSTFMEHFVYKQKDIVYDFQNARPVSSNTVTATPGALTGLFIADGKTSQATRDFFNVPSLMGLAKAHNYSSSLFCSYDTHYDGAWHELNSIFDQFDLVVSKTTLNGAIANDLGMDDRIITKKAIEHLANQTADRPFFTTIIWNNMHFPFFGTEDFVPPSDASFKEVEVARAKFSAGLTDHMLSQVVHQLNASGLLDRTFIGFMSDHGEVPGHRMERIVYPTSDVLSVPLWFHIPDKMMNSTQKQNLINNLDKTVSNLDVVPTIIDVMGWSNDIDNIFSESKSTVHGQTLLKPVSKDRIVFGWQGFPFVDNCEWNHAFFGNATHNVVVHAHKNEIVFEELDQVTHSRIMKTVHWNDIPEHEQTIWMKEMDRYPFLKDQLKICGFKN